MSVCSSSNKRFFLENTYIQAFDSLAKNKKFSAVVLKTNMVT